MPSVDRSFDEDFSDERGVDDLGQREHSRAQHEHLCSERDQREQHQQHIVDHETNNEQYMVEATVATTKESIHEANLTSTRQSSEWAAGAIAALLHDDTDHFFGMVCKASASYDHTIHVLLVVAETLLVVAPSVAMNRSAQVDAETAVHVFSVVGDISSAGLSENEERTCEAPGGTVLRVMVPLRDRETTGFVLGPFTILPLHDLAELGRRWTANCSFELEQGGQVGSCYGVL